MNRLILALIFTMMSFSGISAENDKTSPKLDIKCHVELVGGGETISLWRIPQSQRKTLEQQMLGYKIYSHDSVEKREIYKVHQCVASKDSFSSAAANRLDKSIAR